MDDTNAFDLHAAWIRRAQTDLHAFLEALAMRLEDALPGRVEVTRRREGWLKATHRITALSVRTDGSRYLLDASTPDIRTSRQHEVRGVVVKNEALPLAQWLEALEGELRVLSGSMESARGVLHDFLMS